MWFTKKLILDHLERTVDESFDLSKCYPCKHSSILSSNVIIIKVAEANVNVCIKVTVNLISKSISWLLTINSQMFYCIRKIRFKVNVA